VSHCHIDVISPTMSSFLTHATRTTIRSSLARVSPRNNTFYLLLILTYASKTARPYVMPPPQPPPKQSGRQPGSNTVLLVATGTAAAAGLYWYITRPQDVKRVRDNVKREESQVRTKAKEFGDISKTRTNEVLSQSREKIDNAKVCFSPLTRS
jgi:hypothetical protein